MFATRVGKQAGPRPPPGAWTHVGQGEGRIGRRPQQLARSGNRGLLGRPVFFTLYHPEVRTAFKLLAARRMCLPRLRKTSESLDIDASFSKVEHSGKEKTHFSENLTICLITVQPDFQN